MEFEEQDTNRNANEETRHHEETPSVEKAFAVIETVCPSKADWTTTVSGVLQGSLN